MSDFQKSSKKLADIGIVQLLKILSRILEKLGCRWYVFGAQAVNVYARPRMSVDVDVTVEIDRADVSSFIKEMAGEGFEVPVSDPDSFIQKTRVIPFADETGGMVLDVVLAGPGLEKIFLNRAKKLELGGIEVPVISPEDLIVTKILAGRTKDLEDVEAILQSQLNALDLDWIRQLLQDLEQALDQSDLIPQFEQILKSLD